MTDTAPARPDRPQGVPAVPQAALALMAVVTVMVVGLAGIFASAASAQTLRRPETRVAALTAAAGQIVGAHEPVLAGQRRARAPNYDRTAVGSCVAAETEPASSGTTSLFRSVSGAEAQDILANGFRGEPSGLSYEGKLFAGTAQDAASFGRINYSLTSGGGVPFNIVEAQVPTPFAESLFSFPADGMTAYSVPEEQLAELNELARVTIHDSVPWVPKP